MEIIDLISSEGESAEIEIISLDSVQDDISEQGEDAVIQVVNLNHSPNKVNELMLDFKRRNKIRETLQRSNSGSNSNIEDLDDKSSYNSDLNGSDSERIINKNFSMSSNSSFKTDSENSLMNFEVSRSKKKRLDNHKLNLNLAKQKLSDKKANIQIYENSKLNDSVKYNQLEKDLNSINSGNKSKIGNLAKTKRLYKPLVNDFFVSKMAENFNEMESSDDLEFINIKTTNKKFKEKDKSDSYDSLDEELGIKLSNNEIKKRKRINKYIFPELLKESSPDSPIPDLALLRKSISPLPIEIEAKAKEVEKTFNKDNLINEKLLANMDDELRAIYQQVIPKKDIKKKVNLINNQTCRILCHFPIVEGFDLLQKDAINFHKSIEFVLNLNDDFRLLSHSLCECKQVKYNSLCFEYNGIRVFPYSSPSLIGINEGENVMFDVYLREAYEFLLEKRKIEQVKRLEQLEREEIEKIFKPSTPIQPIQRIKLNVKPPGKSKPIPYLANLETTIQKLLDDLRIKCELEPTTKLRLEFDGLILKPELKIMETDLEGEDLINLWID